MEHLQERGLSCAWHVATRLVLAEDSYIVREGIEQILADCEELELVASCSPKYRLFAGRDTPFIGSVRR